MPGTFDSFLQSLNAPLVANSPMAPTPTQGNAASAIPFATIPNPPATNPANAAVSSPSRLPLFLALGAAGLLAWYFMRKSSHSIATTGGSSRTSRRRRSRRTTVMARSRKSGRFLKRRRASSRRKSWGRKTVTWAR